MDKMMQLAKQIAEDQKKQNQPQKTEQEIFANEYWKCRDCISLMSRKTHGGLPSDKYDPKKTRKSHSCLVKDHVEDIEKTVSCNQFRSADQPSNQSKHDKKKWGKK